MKWLGSLRSPPEPSTSSLADNNLCGMASATPYNLRSCRLIQGAEGSRILPNGARLARAFPHHVQMFCLGVHRSWSFVTEASLLAGARNYCPRNCGRVSQVFGKYLVQRHLAAGGLWLSACHALVQR